ncbi:glycosyltransferase family 4 protein [Candidatus Saccharibacteria bacterium]|nr:glycosyltransferase family 4 protein [Candidatus Saccharibacteria bacterium]
MSSKMLKIGFVLDDTLDKPDGVQQHVLTVGKWLTEQGHEVHYLVANTVRTDIDNIHSLGKFVSLHYNKNNVRTPVPASRRKIKKLLAKHQFDVLHVQLPYSPFLSKQIINNAPEGTAIVGTFHILPASRLHGYSNRALKLLLGKSLQKFDKIVAVSEPAVHFARRAYGVSAEYLPNPIDINIFRAGKRIPEFNARKLNIVFLGRLVKRKGLLELIDAYNHISDDLAKKTRLLICGKGPLKQRANHSVRVDRDVKFLGFVPERDKPNYLASADIAVFPSTGGESFGIVLIEAMAAGAKSVIGGHNPGYASILAPQPYLLFDPSSREAFVEQLELFIQDDKLRARMHDWQQLAVEQYDISVVGPKIVKLYKEAMALNEPKDVVELNAES